MPDTTAARRVNADLSAHLAETREQRLDDFKSFLRIPSISTLPEHAGDVRRAAEWLAGTLRDAGLEHVEV